MRGTLDALRRLPIYIYIQVRALFDITTNPRSPKHDCSLGSLFSGVQVLRVRRIVLFERVKCKRRSGFDAFGEISRALDDSHSQVPRAPHHTVSPNIIMYYMVTVHSSRAQPPQSSHVLWILLIAVKRCWQLPTSFPHKHARAAALFRPSNNAVINHYTARATESRGEPTSKLSTRIIVIY